MCDELLQVFLGRLAVLPPRRLLLFDGWVDVDSDIQAHWNGLHKRTVVRSISYGDDDGGSPLLQRKTAPPRLLCDRDDRRRRADLEIH